MNIRLSFNRFGFQHTNQNGLTLIEILVSILLLGIVATFVAMAIPTSVGLSTQTDEMETTTKLAQKYIEAVQSAFVNDPSLFTTIIDQSTDPPIEISDEYTQDNEYDLSTVMEVWNSSYDEDYGMDVPSLISINVTVAPIKDLNVNEDSNQTVSVTALIRRERSAN